MYQVYIDRPTSFDPDMVGEFKDYDKALELAEKEKAAMIKLWNWLKKRKLPILKFLILLKKLTVV